MKTLGYKKLPPSILGTPKLSPKGLVLARKIWNKIGYTGK